MIFVPFGRKTCSKNTSAAMVTSATPRLTRPDARNSGSVKSSSTGSVPEPVATSSPPSGPSMSSASIVRKSTAFGTAAGPVDPAGGVGPPLTSIEMPSAESVTSSTPTSATLPPAFRA